VNIDNFVKISEKMCEQLFDEIDTIRKGFLTKDEVNNFVSNNLRGLK